MMKKVGIGILCFSVAMTLVFCFVADYELHYLQKCVKNCAAQLRGITECVNDCADEIEDIYAKLERKEDDGK